MPGKVIHLSEEVHARAKRFCEQNQLQMSKWVESLIDAAISGEVIVENKAIVEKKFVDHVGPPVQPQRIEIPQDNPYTRPPFWANRET